VSSDQEKRMARYLLGQLPEEEQAELERLYLADDDLYEQLLSLEDDLRDAYVRNELSTADREAFEQRLLAAPRQGREQEFARNLCHYVEKASTGLVPHSEPVSKWKSLFGSLGMPPRAVVLPALSFAVLVLIAGGWWLEHKTLQHPTPLSQTDSGTSSGNVVPASGQEEPGTIALVLGPGLVRGTEEQSKPLVIPPNINQVRLEAPVQVTYQHYEAILQTVEGNRVWSKKDLEAEAIAGSKRIVLHLPSSLLPPGDYILTIRGLQTAGSPETVAEYTFRVSKS
jgi:hypothetical protein